MKRPDLSQVDPIVRAYIESLETTLAELQKPKRSKKLVSAESIPIQPSEPPTSRNVITISRNGRAKRTPRHFYARQRRGGMGIFDLETTVDDPPTLLAIADEAESLILFTDQGRAFLIPVHDIAQTDVRGRGKPLSEKLKLLEGEKIVAALPETGDQYATLVSQRGWVRRVNRNYLNQRMLPGQRFHKVSEGGYLVGACWTSGNDDVFIATRRGIGIRFSERQIPARGCLGIRINPTDEVVAVAPTQDSGAMFLLTDEGKGTVRQMSGFRKNKAPGAGGKVAIKTDELVGAVAVQSGDDLFVISQLSKLIRFSADEVPPKTGVVQGVNCMALRADATATVTVSRNE